ncbi:response regulator transcription factor [Halogeometricum limi]|uniref:Response regulator receiver domain-containing protein n=1 Tax=Halogeometricum limi TaxID=555875 RepID=A0A1I6GKH8_9EURY|nr:response regulator [Halogeometricum limi]SFR42651.1 Response regulator receiver domain-containing protein [Halogeometricum limi]
MTVTSADVPSERPTVLIADDEAALTDSMAVWLSDDYRVRTAYTGHEALSEFDPSVDVVLLDRHMPGLSGERVMKRLNESDASPKVALLTATSTDDFGPEVEDLGFDTHLTKPISRDELLDAVSALSSQSEPAQR